MRIDVDGYMRTIFTLLLSLGLASNTFAMEESNPKQKPHVFYHEIDTNGFIFYIHASIGIKEVGHSKFHPDIEKPNQGYIETLSVHPDDRRSGIGYHLFKKTINSFIKKGYRIIGWDAKQIGNIPTRQLEDIYLSMIAKLANKYEFNFIMDERKIHEGQEVTPMRIVLKQ